MHILDAVDAPSLRSDIPDFRAGDTVKVHVNIIEVTVHVSRFSRVLLSAVPVRAFARLSPFARFLSR